MRKNKKDRARWGKIGNEEKSGVKFSDIMSIYIV